MGLLKRLRASSAAHARPEIDAVPPVPFPAQPPHSAGPLYPSSSRINVSTATPESITAPRARTPSASAKPHKPFWKRKGKGKETEVLGFSYESTAPSTVAIDRYPPLPNVLQPRIEPRHPYNPHHQARPYGSTPPRPVAQTWDERDMPTPRHAEHALTPKGILKPKGLLGRLDFEREDSSTDDDRSTSDQRHSSYTALNSLAHDRSSVQAPRPHTMAIDSPSSHRLYGQKGTDDAADRPRLSQEEHMEHLISPEKQMKWTPSARRMSQSTQLEEPISPTPRKSSLPPQELGTPTNVAAPAKAGSSEDHQVPSKRRPSSSRRSSFIPIGNPFARSSTRLSLSNDLDGGSAVDDGSFQLRSFRHVSGVSQTENALGQTYHPDPENASDALPQAAAPPLVTSPASVTAPTPSRPPSTTPISRPVSRATSLASMDDHIVGSTRVSAAAFRKGIRRPSEGASVSMDVDDDDLPLGLLRPGMRASSALSLSSMKDGARTPGSTGPASLTSPTRSPVRPVPKVSPALLTPSKQPDLLDEPGAVKKQRSPARSKTTPLISPDEIHPMFTSPAGSPAPSPRLDATGDLPAEGYFSANGPRHSGAAQLQQPVAESPTTLSPAFDFKSLDYPIDAISTSPHAVGTALPDTSPPPLAPPVEIESASVRMSKLTISVPEPKSGGIRSDTAERQDSLDTDLVVRSMAMYGADEDGAGDDENENEPPTPRMALHQQSHSTLFGTDASSDTTSTIRSPLSERLGNLVGPRPMSSKPSLPKLDTLRLNGDGEQVVSPSSDSTVSTTVTTIRDQQSKASSFSRARVPDQIVAGEAHGKTPIEEESESDTDSDDEEEEEVEPPKRPSGPPRSSFTNAPRPRIPLATKASASSQSSGGAGGGQRISTRAQSSDDESSDDDDQPLARIKSKASRSTLAVNETVAAGRPTSMHSPISSSKAMVAKPSVPAPTVHGRRASVPAVVSPPMVAPSKPTAGAGSTSPTKRLWSASPASSQSGLTGDSSAVQPITPNETDMTEGRGTKVPAGPLVPSQWADAKRSSVSWAPQHRQRRDSNYSVATAPPNSLPKDNAQAPPVPAMPNGQTPMDPVMRQRMKEMWQAQYLAAATRAFEDEWERQSNVSGTTGPAPSVHHSYQSQQPPMPMPQYPGYPMPPSPHQQYGIPPFGGYGFPAQVPSQYMYPAWTASPHAQPQPEPSMYAFGPGAQSVYGGEFGPAQPSMGPYSPGPMSPYNRPMSMGFPGSYSTTNLHQQTYDTHHQQQHHQGHAPPSSSSRPSLPTSRSSYFQQQASSNQPSPLSRDPQTRRDRDRENNLDYTPPKGLINSVPNSPRGVGAGNRRSQLGTSVISANDRAPPPTSWRRSTAPLIEWDEEDTTQRKRRHASQVVN